MELSVILPPPAFRRRVKSRRLSLRVPDPEFDLLNALAKARNEPPATTAVVLLGAILDALPKREAPDSARVLERAVRLVREQAGAEREISADLLSHRQGMSESATERRMVLSETREEFAERLDALAAYIEAGEDTEDET